MIANNEGYEYPLSGRHLRAVDELTVGGLATEGLGLLEYDDLLFGGVLLSPERVAEAQSTLQERREARKLKQSAGDGKTAGNDDSAGEPKTTGGNDPLGTGFSPGPAQDRENDILRAPDKPTGNNLTNL